MSIWRGQDEYRKRSQCVASFIHKKQSGKIISDSILSHVTSSNENDECSRICPGMKDFVSVQNSEGVRTHKQK
jgi:hypothetical protein